MRAVTTLLMLVVAGCGGDGGGEPDMASAGGQCQLTARDPLPHFCTDGHGHVCTGGSGEACAYCAGVALGGERWCRVTQSDADAGTSSYLCLNRCDTCSYKGAPVAPCMPAP